MNNKGFVFKVDDIDKYQEGAIEKVAKDIAKELDINALEKTLEYITGEEANKSCEDFNNGYRAALYRVMSLVTNQQQELERYKNIVEELEEDIEDAISEGARNNWHVADWNTNNRGRYDAYLYVMDKLQELKGE